MSVYLTLKYEIRIFYILA